MSTRSLPSGVTATLSAPQRDTVEAWWADLDDDARDEFERLWDARSDDTAYYATVDARGKTEWHELPIQLRGYFVDPETHRENAMWTRDLNEYVNSHEDVSFFLVHRSFHICRAHAIAREVARTGVVPAGFACPFAHAACPFERALDGAAGRAIWLLPVPCRARG
ncbi:hypothetical protein [Sandaracinus amylolyticus]|uniref:hypothetical protein n=1 Tax=Sandaracinus amylolyticus TaxID=927083 RepID=UPI0012ED54DC|nr:hypothetical protein [Sandaracinus amylolyticus]